MNNTEISKERTRNYATIVYTESAPENWQEILQNEHIPCHISPLHDKDINKDGTPKKPHYHIMVMYQSVKTRAQAKSVFDKIGGVGLEALNCPHAYARYLCHLDDPNKAQYPIEEVVSYGGADYDIHISTAKDLYATIMDILDFCTENGIVCFADLILYARHDRQEWFRIICDNSMLLCQFLKSKYWDKNRQGVKRATTATRHVSEAEEPAQEGIEK